MKKNLFSFVLLWFVGAVVMSSSVYAKEANNYLLKQDNAKTSVPDGVVVKDGVILSWPSSAIPENGIVQLNNDIVGIGAGAFSQTPLKSIILPSSLRTIGSEAFAYCNLLQGITIPNGVVSIDEGAFYQCHNLQAVSLPSTLEKMGANVFAHCDKMTTLMMQDGGRVIGESAFYGCTALKNVELSNDLVHIGDNAFGACSQLSEIMIPDGVEELPNNTFQECTSLTKVVLPQGLKTIGRYCFKKCIALSQISLPDGLTSLGGFAFYDCGALLRVDMPIALSEISASVFQGCTNLAAIKIPHKVENIGVSAFRGCANLKIIELPEGVTEIKHSAFLNCSKLSKIILPSSLTAIGLNAFVGCSAIDSVICKASVPPTVKYSFNKTPETKKLYVPEAAIDAYAVAWETQNFASIEPYEAKTNSADGVVTAVYDFFENPWNLEVATKTDAPEVGKILDEQTLERDGVQLRVKKVHDRYWNRIVDNYFKVYKYNTVTFAVPSDKAITKIEFENREYECDLEEISKTDGVLKCTNEEDDKPYVWSGRASQVVFKATLTSAFKRIIVTYEPNIKSGVDNVEYAYPTSNKVYNIYGVCLGDSTTLGNLAPGIYIMNGKKFIKQ